MKKYTNVLPKSSLPEQPKSCLITGHTRVVPLDHLTRGLLHSLGTNTPHLESYKQLNYNEKSEIKMSAV